MILVLRSYEIMFIQCHVFLSFSFGKYPSILFRVSVKCESVGSFLGFAVSMTSRCSIFDIQSDQSFNFFFQLLNILTFLC